MLGCLWSPKASVVTTAGNKQRCIALFSVYVASNLDQSIRGYLYLKVIHACDLSDCLWSWHLGCFVHQKWAILIYVVLWYHGVGFVLIVFISGGRVNTSVYCVYCSVSAPSVLGRVSTCVLGWDAAWGPFPRGLLAGQPPFLSMIIIWQIIQVNPTLYSSRSSSSSTSSGQPPLSSSCRSFKIH